jgi:esterase/lipase
VGGELKMNYPYYFYDGVTSNHKGMIMRKRFGTFLIFLILVLAVSCTTTFNHRNPYPNMEIVRYGNSQAYVFRNKASDTLIINIEGSGWDSVLGIKNEKRWLATHQGAQLLQVLGDTYTFFIPEKLNRQPGLDYSRNREDREKYTAENLLDCYLESINGYLAEHAFSSIVLIGNSEGAVLLPLIYERMNDKHAVTALVSLATGGLSFYESYSILSVSSTLPEEWKEMYRYFVEEYNPEHTYRDTYVEDIYGMTYRWFTSFMHIKPFDYYKNILIPILFIHGETDYNIPVESTRYIQENLPDKPFEYRYYPWDHQPRNRADFIQFRNDIAEWVRKTAP